MKYSASMLRREPFRVLFPLGYFCLVFGLGIWSVDLLGQSPDLARLHAVFLGDGFLFAFFAGILLTEVPSLLRLPSMGPLQLGLLILSLFGMGLAGLGQNVFYAQAFHLAAVLDLALYLGLCLLSARAAHPGPILAFAGSLLSAAGTIVFLFAEAFRIPHEFGSWGAYMGFQAFSLLTVAAFLSWSRPEASAKRGLGRLWISLSILLPSIGLEAAGLYALHSDRLLRAAYLLRAVWLIGFVVRPKGGFALVQPGLHAFFVRAGAWALFAGTLAAAISPARTVVFNHVGFLGGFAWIALAAGTAVIAERMRDGKRRTGVAVLAWGALALGAGIALRIAAAYATAARPTLLGLGAACALAPAFLWAVVFFPTLADPDGSPRETPSAHPVRAARAKR